MSEAAPVQDPATPLLRVEGLTTRFPAGKASVPVVDGVSFHIHQAEVLALVGESGCGKSQTALSLLRLVPKPGVVASGSVWLEDRDLLKLPIPLMRKVRGHEISMIFQEPMTSLNPVVRVGEQVMEAVLLHERVSRAAAAARALELFRRVGIPDPEARLQAYPHQLSGGLKQRVMIAMALSTRPKLLIADEPTTALDVTIQAQILELLRELTRDYKTSVLLITHDLGVVNELSQRVCVMYAGRIVEQGPTRSVLAKPSHPYTRGLLASMPARARPGERLTEIPGVVPRPVNWPAGCRFCTRCPERFEPCDRVVPKLLPVSSDQVAACHARERDRNAEATS